MFGKKGLTLLPLKLIEINVKDVALQRIVSVAPVPHKILLLIILLV